MDLKSFRTEMINKWPVDTVIDNPGGGKSKIASYSETAVSYVRGQSTIRVTFADLFQAYQHFKGRTVTSVDLRKFAPSTFDSKAASPGHSCNCTLFFLLLKDMGVVSEIHGRGVRGDPYYLDVPA